MKVAINGFGRIGRLVFRQIFNDKKIEVVAVNDLTSPKELAYLLQYDSAQGRFEVGNVKYTDDEIIVCGKKIKVLAIRSPKDLPWKQLKVDVVVESTGLFLKKEAAMGHIEAGAQKVLLSAPSPSADIKTIVYGINDYVCSLEDKIVSAASCTTNCLALPLKYLHEKFQIKMGYMTTVHSATNDQRVLDLPHPKDFRRGRSALNNIIPASTGAAAAIGKVIPELNGKLDGMAFRTPTVTGSAIILTATVEAENPTVKEVNDYFIKKAQDNASFGVTHEPIVSTDVIGSTFGSILDLSLTSIVDAGNGNKMIKIVAWYDNENSYVSQYVRTLKHLLGLCFK